MERRLRLMGRWFTTVSFRTKSGTPREAQGAWEGRPARWSVRAGTRVSMIKEDFPEPLTPVTTVRAPVGRSRSTPFRL